MEMPEYFMVYLYNKVQYIYKAKPKHITGSDLRESFGYPFTAISYREKRRGK
jgi:hypothetical protein